LCHGDYKLGHIYNRNGKLGVIDWQTLCIRNGTIDIAYLLASKLPFDMTQELEEKCLLFYYQKLKERNVNDYSFETFKSDYKLNLVNVFVAHVFGIAVGDFKPIQPWFEKVTINTAKAIKRNHALEHLRKLMR